MSAQATGRYLPWSASTLPFEKGNADDETTDWKEELVQSGSGVAIVIASPIRSGVPDSLSAMSLSSTYRIHLLKPGMS